MTYRLVLFVALCMFLSADTLVLTNGQRFEGQLESVSDDEVVLVIGGGRLRFRRSQVAEIIRTADASDGAESENAEQVDPYALAREPYFFAGHSLWLPPAQVSLEGELDELPGMLLVAVDCLGTRFRRRPDARAQVVAVERDSAAHRSLKQAPRGAQVELQLRCEQRTRRPGGVVQTWYLLAVEQARVCEDKTWSELHMGYDRYLGQRFTLFMRFADPLIAGELGTYSLVVAESEPGFDLGNHERPAGWLNPVVLKRKPPELPHGPLAPFCRVRVRVEEIMIDDPDRGRQSVGLAVIEQAWPLQAAEAFGAPALLTGSMGGDQLDGGLLTDPVAVAGYPERFVGETFLLPGRATLGDAFERDTDVRGLQVVELSSLAASFGRDAAGGQVVLATEQHGAVARTLAQLGYQAPVILEVQLQERRRRLGGVLEIGYYLGSVVGVQRWTDTEWFPLMNGWQELRGQRFHLLLRPDGLIAADLFLDDGARPLLASYSDQHQTPRSSFKHRLLPVLPQDADSQAALGPVLAEASGFCRVEVEISDGRLANEAHDPVGVARILALQPLQTRAETNPSRATDAVVRDHVAYHELLPDQDDLQEWFEDRREELRRQLYRDLSAEEKSAPRSAYRWVDGGGTLRWGDQLPSGSLRAVWELGTRTISVSNSYSYFSGPNTVTTMDFGTSTRTVASWHRLLWNRTRSLMERPELGPSEARFDALAQAAEQLRPARNTSVGTIIAVEEQGRLRFLRADVAQRADMIALWETSESRQNPAAKERLAEMRTELAERQAELLQLQTDYAAALASVRHEGVLYQALLGEASDFATGRLLPIGYE